MSPHPLTNFEIRKYYQNEPRFNGVYSRNNLTEMKDVAYVINSDKYSDIGTHWVALYVHNNCVTYFEHIPNEIKTFTNCPLSFVLRPPVRDTSQNKSITTNIFRIKYDSILCGYFCIGFIDFMLKEKALTEYTNPFSPTDLKKNHDIILNYFMSNV